MRSELWKIRHNRINVLKFAVAMWLWTGELRPSQASNSDMLTVSWYEKISELQGNSPATIETPEMLRHGEKDPSRPCVPKCCDLNYALIFENKSCVKSEAEFLPDFEDRPDYSQTAKDLPVKTRYEYYIGDPCSDGKYMLNLTAYPDDKYFIYANGTLLHSNRLHGKEDFCLESLNGTIQAFLCFGVENPGDQPSFTYVIYAAGLIISVPFLLATALVYLCVDSLRDPRGKSLSCHVLCLATGYSFLAIVQLSSNRLLQELCIAFGFIIQFSFVASFFWLNVLCYDTWRCMSNDEWGIRRRKNFPSEKVVFCSYSLYGWYGPSILTIITLIMDLEPAIPESYLKPKFGLRSCWFYSDDAAFPYFYGPIAIIIFINIIFFFLSARKIYSQQRRREECKALNRNSTEEIREINLSIRLRTKTLQECLYLFCVMGINWAAEVLSWAIGGAPQIWLVTDVFNALQGVIIFYLFIIRPVSVRSEVKRRIYSTRKKMSRCNGRHEEESKTISPHWGPGLPDKTEERRFDDENNKVSSRSATQVSTAV